VCRPSKIGQALDPLKKMLQTNFYLKLMKVVDLLFVLLFDIKKKQHIVYNFLNFD